jgi:hypothetical protein
VKDYLKQQATMKCKAKNESECTHIYNIRKKTFPGKFDELIIEHG